MTDKIQDLIVTVYLFKNYLDVDPVEWTGKLQDLLDRNNPELAEYSSFSQYKSRWDGDRLFDVSFIGLYGVREENLWSAIDQFQSYRHARYQVILSPDSMLYSMVFVIPFDQHLIKNHKWSAQVIHSYSIGIGLRASFEDNFDYHCHVPRPLLGSQVEDPVRYHNFGEQLKVSEYNGEFPKIFFSPLTPLTPEEQDAADMKEIELTSNAAMAMEVANLTDLGNANRLVALAKSQYRYVSAWKSWIVWKGSRWEVDNDGQIHRLANEVARRQLRAAATADSETRRKVWLKHAMATESKKSIEAMIALAKTMLGVAISPGDLDADPWVLNCQNGTLDLRTGRLRPHRKEDFITKLVPIDYDLDEPCVRWTEFLYKITRGRRPLMDYLQKAVGYCLTGSTEEQVIFLPYGTGANGKSTFLDLIMDMLGDYAKQTDFGTFLERKSESVRNDLASLVGARFVSASEADAGKYLSESVVKQLTGGDRIVARFLFKEFFEFKPTFKIWLASNHRPSVHGTDHGIWRRLVLLPFDVTISEKDRDRTLPLKLRAELPGILAWAVRGLRMWQMTGLTTPDAIREATRQYREDEDVLADFLRDWCILDPSATVGTRSLWVTYQAWCMENQEKPKGKTHFEKCLSDRGITKERTNTYRHWKGIALKSDNRDGKVVILGKSL